MRIQLWRVSYGGQLWMGGDLWGSAGVYSLTSHCTQQLCEIVGLICTTVSISENNNAKGCNANSNLCNSIQNSIVHSVCPVFCPVWCVVLCGVVLWCAILSCKLSCVVCCQCRDRKRH